MGISTKSVRPDYLKKLMQIMVKPPKTVIKARGQDPDEHKF